MSGPTPGSPQQRRVRSFVRRGGRITESQTRALAELWTRYGIDFSPAPLELDDVFGRRSERVSIEDS